MARTPSANVRKPLRRAGKARDALAILLRLGREPVECRHQLAEAAGLKAYTSRRATNDLPAAEAAD